jgi:hypothetical protein
MQTRERDMIVIMADPRQPVDEAQAVGLQLRGTRVSRSESTDGRKAGNHLAGHLSIQTLPIQLMTSDLEMAWYQQSS